MTVLHDLVPAALPGAVEAHQRELGERWTRMQGGLVIDRDEFLLTVVGLPVSFTNCVYGARLDPERVRPAVEEVVGTFRAHRVPGTWWIGPSTVPAGLGRHLLAAGFHHDEDMPWMAASLAEIPEPVANGVEVRRVASPEDQAQWLAVMTEGMGLDDHERVAMTRLAEVVGFGEDAGWQRFVGRVHGEPVASAGIMLGGGVAGIYNVGTLPAMRGRGVGSVMTAAAMRRGAEMGYRVAVLGSARRAVPLYERLGFRHVCDMAVYVWQEVVS
jgi:ribosomal protein S18 acetylase RimI-like enzyme